LIKKKPHLKEVLIAISRHNKHWKKYPKAEASFMIPRLWMPVCPCLQRENSILKRTGHLTDRLCRMMPVGLHIEEIGKAAANLK
jgi:hypothetical protein